LEGQNTSWDLILNGCLRKRLWLQNLVFHYEQRMDTEGISEQGEAEYIWAQLSNKNREVKTQ
jgi:hypothetical protein